MRQLDLGEVFHGDSALRPPVYVGKQSTVGRECLVEKTGDLGMNGLG
jgi:hypothetical protein